ncbi:hypothetical protein BJX62DRAFT_239670 [Aspergillus germanicus]
MSNPTGPPMPSFGSTMYQLLMELSRKDGPLGPFGWLFVRRPRFGVDTSDNISEGVLEDLCLRMDSLAGELERMEVITRQLRKENEALKARVSSLERGGN